MMNTLLIVDDERAFGEFVKKVASGLGFAVTVTETPAALLENLLPHPTVIIVDLQMPGFDGIELLRELAAQRVTSKVVVASGVDSRTIDTVHRLGSELGLDMGGSINKPIRVAELQALLTGMKKQKFEPTVETLTDAIATDALFPLFQPKIDVASGRCIGVEMLVRWREASGTVIEPSCFIAFAEQMGLIDSLTEWVLRQGIAQAGEWHRMGLDLKVSVNASATNMHDVTLPDRVEAMCRQAGVPPSRLVIELTETATMRDAARLMEVLARLRIKEVELSIDDFGTGYSSLVQLHRLPFTEIKIDQSFITTMNHESEVIARAITTMGHALGMIVTAEGVETQQTLDLLEELGVDQVQGYLLSRPIPALDIPDFVRMRSGGG